MKHLSEPYAFPLMQWISPHDIVIRLFNVIPLFYALGIFGEGPASSKKVIDHLKEKGKSESAHSWKKTLELLYSIFYTVYPII